MLSYEMIAPVNEEGKRVSTWIVEGLGSGGLCHSEIFISNLEKKNQKPTASIQDSPFQKHI